MIEFRDALTDLLEEFGTDDGGREDITITSRELLFYHFDVKDRFSGFLFMFLVAFLCCI